LFGAKNPAMASPIQAERFATAAQPVVADTVIVTDAQGLEEGLVEIPTSGGVIPAYRAAPAGGRDLPIVLIVQEIFGVHEHIRDVTRRFAKLGYLAIAPELFVRQGDVAKLPSVEAIREVVAKVPDAQVLSDLDATLAFAERTGGDGKRVALTGFCWGGRIAWLYAAHQPRLKAAVAWYGRLEGDRTELQPRFPRDVLGSLKAPVLGLYGGQDQGIPLASVNAVQADLEKLGSPSRIFVYPEAPHAFYADYRAAFRPQAAEDGFARLRRWFQERGV
jgi:carboxymethylenebutenolidase